MISKELLSEVLGCEVNSCFIDNNICSYENVVYEDISIYELAHKCKEFAYKLNFNILTEKVSGNGYFGYIIKTNQSLENYGYIQEIKVVSEFIHNQSEPEAIFKACQYILDLKK